MEIVGNERSTVLNDHNRRTFLNFNRIVLMPLSAQHRLRCFRNYPYYTDYVLNERKFAEFIQQQNTFFFSFNQQDAILTLTKLSGEFVFKKVFMKKAIYYIDEPFDQVGRAQHT